MDTPERDGRRGDVRRNHTDREQTETITNWFKCAILLGRIVKSFMSMVGKVNHKHNRLGKYKNKNKTHYLFQNKIKKDSEEKQVMHIS